MCVSLFCGTPTAGCRAFIYQRVAMAASMDVAARMMGVDGVEVEAVFSHWAQPAA